MSILYDYTELQIQVLENEIMIIKSLAKNFKSVVLAEFKKVRCLKTAFNNISHLYLQLVGIPFHLTYDQFLKTL